MLRLLADLTLALHAAFIVFVAAGALLVWRWPKVAWLHGPALAWGTWITFTQRPCPLTAVEDHFRRAAGEAGVERSFIEDRLLGFVYPQGLSEGHWLALGAALVLANLVLYTIAWRARSAK
jgi:hypothetical protein